MTMRRPPRVGHRSPLAATSSASLSVRTATRVSVLRSAAAAPESVASCCHIFGVTSPLPRLRPRFHRRDPRLEIVSVQTYAAPARHALVRSSIDMPSATQHRPGPTMKRMRDSRPQKKMDGLTAPSDRLLRPVGPGSAHGPRAAREAAHKQRLWRLYGRPRNLARFATFAGLPLRQMRCAPRTTT